MIGKDKDNLMTDVLSCNCYLVLGKNLLMIVKIREMFLASLLILSLYTGALTFRGFYRNILLDVQCPHGITHADQLPEGRWSRLAAGSHLS
jgi:hypothetical protein